jgi:hypothetical protein
MNRAMLKSKGPAIATAVGLTLASTCICAEEPAVMSGEYKTLPNGQTVYYPADGEGGYWAWVPAEAAGKKGDSAMAGTAGTSPIPEGATGKFMVAPDGQVFFIPQERGGSETDGPEVKEGTSGYFKVAPDGDVYFYPSGSQGGMSGGSEMEATEAVEGTEGQEGGRTPSAD